MRDPILKLNTMDFPRNFRQTQASIRGPFKRLGTNASQMVVVWSSIVNDFDLIKNISTGQISIFVNTLFDTIFFKSTEE
jgi:hypothetical protein